VTDTISAAHVVTALRDWTIKIWDAIRGQCLHTLVRVLATTSQRTHLTLLTRAPSYSVLASSCSRLAGWARRLGSRARLPSSPKMPALVVRRPHSSHMGTQDRLLHPQDRGPRALCRVPCLGATDHLKFRGQRRRPGASTRPCPCPCPPFWNQAAFAPLCAVTHAPYSHAISKAAHARTRIAARVHPRVSLRAQRPFWCPSSLLNVAAVVISNTDARHFSARCLGPRCARVPLVLSLPCPCPRASSSGSSSAFSGSALGTSKRHAYYNEDALRARRWSGYVAHAALVSPSTIFFCFCSCMLRLL
jgi:hypothetical protein